MVMQVKFVVDPVWVWVVSEDRVVHRLIDDMLTVVVPNYWYSKAYRMGLWDGKKRFYDSVKRRFLTGFLFRVLEKLYEKGVKVEVVGDGYMVGVDEVVEGIDGLVLNGIDEERWKKTQLPVLKKMLQMKRCSVRMATGSGKTEVIAGVCKALKDKNVLILVHRVELLEQTVKRIRDRIGEVVGRVSSDVVNLQRVNVGMVQSVWSKLPQIGGWLKDKVDVLVIDECHHTGAETWIKVSMACGAKWRYGLSGTPITRNEVRDMYLIGLTGEPLVGVGVNDLVEMGYAVRPVVRFVTVPDVSVDGGSWWEVSEQVFGNKKLFDILDGIVQLHGRRNLVVFVERVKHGVMLERYLREKGYQVVFTHGGLEDWLRVNIVENMKKGKYDVVIATTIFDEGVDVPGITGVVFWCSNKSIVRILQRIGRGLRVEEGKESVYIYDFVVDVKYLSRHVRERAKIYEGEKFEVELYLWSWSEKVLKRV